MESLTRFNDWSERLQTYLDRVRDEPFEWGSHDCGLFVNGAIKATTGHDFIGHLANTYSSKIEAARVLRDEGFGTLEGAISNALGKPVAPALAGRGDIVLKGKALGVAVSHGWSWFVGDRTVGFTEDGQPITRAGLVAIHTLSCDRAFKVAPVPSQSGAQ